MDRKIHNKWICALLAALAALLCACRCETPPAAPTETPAVTAAVTPRNAVPCGFARAGACGYARPDGDASGPTVGAGGSAAELTEAGARDDTFFRESAFLGNSLVDGLRHSGRRSAGSFSRATRWRSSVRSRAERPPRCGPRDARRFPLRDAPRQDHILLGINEIAFDADYFPGSTRPAGHDAELDRRPSFIMGLTPCPKRRSDSSELFQFGAHHRLQRRAPRACGDARTALRRHGRRPGG